jgi:O-antigen/teichoic acid export membrane protein
MDARAVALAPERADAEAAGASPSDAATDLRRVLKNAVSLTGAYVLPRLCTFAAAVVAARALGVVAFGQWGSAAALAVILSVTATLGMMQMLIREIARTPDRAPTLIGAANVAKLATTTLMVGATALVAAGPLGYDSAVVTAALLLALAYGVGAFAENLGAYFQGIERMSVWMQAQALYGIVTGLLGIALAIATRDLVWFCVAPVVGQTIAFAWLLRCAPFAVRTAWVAPAAEVKRLLSGLAPFAAAFLLLTAYYKVDIILLDRWRGASEAGIYAAAYRFVDIAQALSVVIASALYPRLSRLGSRAGRPAARAIELMLLAAVPASALLWIVREPLVAMLFGEVYAGAAGALALLAPALPFLALNAIATFMLAAAGRIGIVAGSYAAALALTVALNAAWIPPLGALGAARAMVVAELSLSIALVLAAGRVADARPRLSAFVPALAAAAVAVIVGASGLGPASALAISTAAVAVIYALFRVMPADERTLLRRAVSG